MAAAVGGVRVAVALLMCVLGGQALDLLRATATSGSEYQSKTGQTISITYCLSSHLERACCILLEKFFK